MKTIICGMCTATYSQTIDAIQSAINHGAVITEVVSGCAPGTDGYGELWGEVYQIPVKRFPADWNKHGRAAGPIRNSEMAAYADQLIAVWDGKSRGTGDMVRKAQAKGMKLFIYEVQR